ncbi:hypothetical protein [Cryptosporangium sp. NPDC048952]|uniref:hypothetical protein n=1 Tax=Cryptosporangium sp. NPDC048952 TaxID=3363961 RepID=UPI003719A4C9
MAGPEGRPFLRMFGQWRENPVQQLWPGFPRLATTDWLEPLADGLRSIDRELLMDLDATGDAERTNRAFDDFLATLEPRQACSSVE